MTIGQYMLSKQHYLENRMELAYRWCLVGCVLLAGCNHEDRITKLEKQSQDLAAEIKKTTAAADFDMQAKCAKDSRMWFNENWRRDKDTLFLSYTNHYNKSKNQCFINVEDHYGTFGQSWVMDMAVWDIYENEKYANISVTHLIDSKFNDSESTVSCEVYGTKCKSVDEFNKLVSPFMSD
jgi:outer membrane murein-binding lipoprotein Lpp